MATPTRNVYQRLAECKAIVAETAFKKVKGEGLKFAYLPIDQIKPIVEDAMLKAGLVLLRGEIEAEPMREPWTSASQYGPGSSTWFHMRGRRTFTWVNIDDPTDRTDPQVYESEAKDNSDKTFSKLNTAILKAFYKDEFNISDSPKDDIDNTEDEVKAEKEAARRASEAKAAKDPFFGGSPKKETKPAEPAPAPNPEPTEVTADRPRDTMIRTIIKAYTNMELREAVKKAIQEAGASAADTDDWSDDQVKAIYNATVKAGRAGQ